MNTPWGKSQQVRKIVTGVVWVDCAGHGGLGVTPSAADKYLSGAAIEFAEFHSGYFWFEEDARYTIVLYEHPEWQAILAPGSAKTEAELKEIASRTINSYYPEYFAKKEAGYKRPKLTIGQRLTIARPFAVTEPDLAVGAEVEVSQLTGSHILATTKSKRTVRFQLSSYYGTSFQSIKFLEPVA